MARGFRVTCSKYARLASQTWKTFRQTVGAYLWVARMQTEASKTRLEDALNSRGMRVIVAV